MLHLKSCPFCGCKAAVKDERTLFVVECTNQATCGIVMCGQRAWDYGDEPQDPEDFSVFDWDYLKQTAIDRWNNRIRKKC